MLGPDQVQELAMRIFAIIIIAGLFTTALHAQVPITGSSSKGSTDTAMIFTPSQPLIKSQTEAAREYPNTWGINASFSDYGFGGGLFLGHAFNPDWTIQGSAEISTAQGSREFDLLTTDK